jgi:hypothetical protein
MTDLFNRFAFLKAPDGAICLETGSYPVIMVVVIMPVFPVEEAAVKDMVAMPCIIISCARSKEA